MKTIILTILSLIIYDLGKKGIKILLIKWNKKKLDLIINGVTKNMKMKNINQDIDQDYWEENNKWI